MNLNDAVCETISQLKYLIDIWEYSGASDDYVESRLYQIYFDLKSNLEKKPPKEQREQQMETNKTVTEAQQANCAEANLEAINEMKQLIKDWEHGNVYHDTLADNIALILHRLKQNLAGELTHKATPKKYIEEENKSGYTVINFDDVKLEHFSSDVDLTEYLEELLESNLSNGYDNILVFEGIHCPLTITTRRKIEISKGYEKENRNV